MHLYRYVTWPLLKWRTRRNARLDASRDIPGEASEVTFLTYIALRLHRQGVHLQNRWAQLDEALKDQFMQACLQHETARQSLDEAEADLTEARKRYAEWKAEPTRRACEQALRARSAALKAVQRAWERRERARIRRQSRWEQMSGLWAICEADYKQLAALYRTENMRHRETNRMPPALLPPNLPDAEAPAPLRALDWASLLEEAGAAVRVEAAPAWEQRGKEAK